MLERQDKVQENTESAHGWKEGATGCGGIPTQACSDLVKPTAVDKSAHRHFLSDFRKLH